MAMKGRFYLEFPNCPNSSGQQYKKRPLRNNPSPPLILIKTDTSIDLTKKGVLHAVSANLKYTPLMEAWGNFCLLGVHILEV